MEKRIIEEETNSRRSFLKKAAYVAPTIVALGSMPISAAAAGASNVSINRDSSTSVTGSTSDPSNDDRGGIRRSSFTSGT